jgi:hypothetical protein
MFEFGEPVFVEAKLINASGEEREVLDALDPSLGVVRYDLRKPSGAIVPFVPLGARCDEGRNVVLHPDHRPCLYEAVNLTYGSRGFSFMEPGRYQVAATLPTPTGYVRSAPLTVWIRYPSATTERFVVPTFRDDVGKYLALWGSPVLGEARSVLAEFVARKSAASHPLSALYRALESLLDLDGFKELNLQEGRIKETLVPLGEEDQTRRRLGLGEEYTLRGRSPLPNILFGHLFGKLAQCLCRSGRTVQGETLFRDVCKQLTHRGMPPWALSRYQDRWGFDDSDAPPEGPS